LPLDSDSISQPTKGTVRGDSYETLSGKRHKDELFENFGSHFENNPISPRPVAFPRSQTKCPDSGKELAGAKPFGVGDRKTSTWLDQPSKAVLKADFACFDPRLREFS
jgi:hypothetical protein